MRSQILAVSLRAGVTGVWSPEWVRCTASNRGKVRGLRIGSMLVTCCVMPSMRSASKRSIAGLSAID